MTQHPTEPGLIAQEGSEAAGTDILAQVDEALEVVTGGLWRDIGGGHIVGYRGIPVAKVSSLGNAQFIATARLLMPQLRDEIEQLRERVDSLIEDRVTDGLGIKSLTVENGAANLSVTTSGLAEQTVLTMMDGLADMLDDATNYVEFDLRRRGKEPVSVCVRRYAHPTPHELREVAEREREEARSEVERLRGALKRVNALADEWISIGGAPHGALGSALRAVLRGDQ